MNKTITGVLIAIASITNCFHASAQKFTIPIFPDTQEAVTRKHEMFYGQVNWIAKHRDSLKAPIVLHVGDLVNFDNVGHYEVASKGYQLFDKAKIPYAITVGNHDTEAVGENSGSAAPGNVNQNLRKTTKYNRYFPTDRFKLMKGTMEKGISDNSFHTFKVKNTQWLVITLEFCAREKAAKWMDSVISAYPKHNAIVLTHFHLTSNGQINKNNAGYGDLSPEVIFNKYIKPHKNVLLVLSGHVCTTASRVDDGTEGNKIYQILQDYQCADNGGGYIRLLEIDVDKRSISGLMYSPFYNKIDSDPKTRVMFSDVEFLKK
ncbi:metallophosphoesterase [Mucilaginibacter myungsuensis]|uniref:Metallophosphoesterase n=1 Tax=Mucilaginibacter myungsuensis TaxID=649104 RepID=A0A929PX56_9SPHI|nr:metallophosphoesterase [Mucilaginibacter myungsuensis]MBE9662045.1 metallophosphoesterase [Mucilaginibacter myungsuensis]MDN3599522.1 metallophosphoesterase [Mucilaginibacter myungsuensis]